MAIKIKIRFCLDARKSIQYISIKVLCKGIKKLSNFMD